MRHQAGETLGVIGLEASQDLTKTLNDPEEAVAKACEIAEQH